jgi:hypothetical protein
MAFDNRRILTFGGVGVALAVFFIIFFLPVENVVEINPTVSLQEIPGYGFLTMKISSEMINLVHMNITIQDFEVMGKDGQWTPIEVIEKFSFDLLQLSEKKITVDIEGLRTGIYDAFRFKILEGIENSNATLSNGEVVPLDVPFFKLEFQSRFETDEVTDNFTIIFTRGAGQISENILPDYYITVGTIKFEVLITTN